VASSSTYTLTQVGTVPYFRPTGTTLTLPTSDVNYSHLMKIKVWLLDAGAPVSAVAELSAPWSPDGSHNITWPGNLVAQSSIGKNYTLRFDCLNEIGTITAGAHTETLSVPAAVPLSPPVTLVGLPSGSEVGPVTTDLRDQLQHTRIRVTATIS